MWHSGQVSQQQHNNQRTPLQQNQGYAQQDAAAAASHSWGRTQIPSGAAGSAAGPQQYTASGGLIRPAQFLPAVVPAVQLSLPGLHQHSAQLHTNLCAMQHPLQPVLSHQQFSLQSPSVQPLPQAAAQQPWPVQQAWAIPQQQQQAHLQQPQTLQHHHQQQLQQAQPQQLQLLQQHTHVLAQSPGGGRGWGGQRLPYPRPDAAAAEQHYAAMPDAGGRLPGGRGRDRGGRGGGRGAGGGSGRGWRAAGGGGGSGPGSAHTDAVVHQLFMAVRQLPRVQAAHEAVAGRLAALDGRGLAMLMKQLAANGLAAQAWELFDWLRSLDQAHELTRLLDVFAYTAMISLCSSSGSRRDMDLALALSREMVERCVPRNVHTFSALMNVCIKAGQHQAALDVWRELQEAGCRPNVVTYNTLIDVYGKTGQWAEALKVLARMKEEGMEPVTRTYNTLMIACNSSNQWHEALGVYNQMLAVGHPPNTTTYNALITAYSKAGRLEKVMEALREMEAAGCERTVITYSALISACERDGQWELAVTMFGQMLREGCIPNIITYNSLITALAAGAQWERAAEIFLQLRRQGCEPDVVTYTALINAYEKGGQWRRALQAFDQMLQQGCRTDHVVYGAIVDALWDSGIVAAQTRAGRIHYAAIVSGTIKPIAATTGGASGVYGVTQQASAGGSGSISAGVGLEVQELHLAVLATGTAVVSFLSYLAELREIAITTGPEAALPARVILRFARLRSGRDSSTALQLRDALLNWLQVRGSPFKLVHESVAAAAPRLEAAAADLVVWLLSDAMALALAPYGSRGGGSGDPIAAAMDGTEEENSRDARLEVACRDAFEEIRRFETTHCLSVASMGPPYLTRRRDLATDILRVAATLQLPYDAAHDAVLLLDRLMSAAPQLREDLLSMASVTALRMTAVAAAAAAAVGRGYGSCGGGGGGGGGGSPMAGGGSQRSTALVEAELDSRLAQVTGLPTLGFQSMEMNIQSALAGDTAAISALRCLRLYLRRLGFGDGWLAAEELQDISGPSLEDLMSQALRDPEFLNYRPSATAAAALYCHRLRRGDTPPWPAAVAALTGYADLEHPELAAAVGAIQRLIIELSTPGMRGGGGGGASSSSAVAAAAAVQMTALLSGS